MAKQQQGERERIVELDAGFSFSSPIELASTVSKAPFYFAGSASADLAIAPTDCPVSCNSPDSAIGDLDDEWDKSSTTSISSEDSYHREHKYGRFYHGYRPGRYMLPNDNDEKGRLDSSHRMWSEILQGRLTDCPHPTAGRVLDVGTGTGLWATKFAEQNPAAEILGVDLSPIQPTSVPPNLNFEIDDLGLAWSFKHKFKLVFCRGLQGSFQWTWFLEQVFDHLESGGYIEIQDVDLEVRCDDETLADNSALRKWSRYMRKAAHEHGRPIVALSCLKDMLKGAGFEAVEVRTAKMPTNGWSTDPSMKKLETWASVVYASDLRGISIASLRQILGWGPNGADKLIASARNEWRDPSIHAYVQYYTIYARKPLSDCLHS